MKYAAVIFDLDGTLMNTLGGISDALNYAAAKQSISPFTDDKVKSMIGNGIRKLIDRAFDSLDEKGKERAYADFTARYKVKAKELSQPYDGANDFLIALRSDGIKVAIASNKDDYAVKALAAEYFCDCVDFSVGATGNNPLKPHPYMIDFVSEKLSVPKSQLAYVGDSEVDLLTAANSGVDGYIVDWGYALNKNFDTVRSFDDLYKLLTR